MFVPPGFEQQSVVTALGRVVYYTATPDRWLNTANPAPEKATANLVFLHGFGGGSSAYEWSKVYPAFAAEYRIFAPDLLGWGRSEHPERDYQPSDYINTIVELIENTCPSAPIVIASSLTAALTVRAAIAHPELFKALILTTPSGLSDFGQDYKRSFFAQLVSTPVIDRTIYSLGIANSVGIRNFLEQRQFAEPNRITPEMVEAYLASAQQPNAEYAALSFVRGDLCFDLAAYLEQLTTPTAILWGRQSAFTSPEMGQRLAKLNPQAIKVFQLLDDVGLTPQLEVPAVTIALIRRYLTLLQ
ncbi:MAG: alpha/beta hydrolase [Aphanocapsa sp. GSE-SYN-MK-11-07L]|jgi:pimeloyl-ACP methyl ester carboxylesterase|nr:alpha/beta hydrolase [Aphanocapsa sp. GSE-SYN-MK-11-07L]